MKQRDFVTLSFLILFFTGLSSQITIEGYVFQADNRGFLNRVHVKLVEDGTGKEVSNATSDLEGFFSFSAMPNHSYRLIANKEMFEEKVVTLSTATANENNKVFTRIEMSRAPGYIFEITMAEKRINPDVPVDAIRGALIEVYNNTTEKIEVIYKDHPYPDFQVNLLKGNHYTILIRKEGYISKRLEAFVDVEGCILCFEGVGNVGPGVSDNLTEGNDMGVLLANLELERIEKGKTFEINNLYYDYGKWELQKQGRDELNKIITLFKDNPGLIIELGSHTDSRGKNIKNQELSEKRAQSAVRYLKTYGNISDQNIIARGYGESKILNECKDGVECTESKHAKNRRTELKIIGETSGFTFKTLEEIKAEEKMEAMIKELQNQEQVRVKEGERLSDVLNQQTKEEVTLSEYQSGVEEIPEVPEEDLMPPDDGIIHRIVIHFSYHPLPANHRIYTDHDHVFEYVSPENYRYYLIGSFTSEADAHDSLEDQWLRKYPNAYIMSFRGKERIH